MPRGKQRRLCSVSGCKRQHYAHGMCQLHYGAWRRRHSARDQETRAAYRRGPKYEAHLAKRRDEYRKNSVLRQLILSEHRDWYQRNKQKAYASLKRWQETTDRGRLYARRQPYRLPRNTPLPVIEFFEVVNDLKKELRNERKRVAPRSRG